MVHLTGTWVTYSWHGQCQSDQWERVNDICKLWELPFFAAITFDHFNRHQHRYYIPTEETNIRLFFSLGYSKCLRDREKKGHGWNLIEIGKGSLDKRAGANTAIPFADALNVITFLPGYMRASSSYVYGLRGWHTKHLYGLILAPLDWVIVFIRDRTGSALLNLKSAINSNRTDYLLCLTPSTVLPKGASVHRNIQNICTSMLWGIGSRILNGGRCCLFLKNKNWCNQLPLF